MATVGVRGGNADGVAVYPQGRTIHGGQESRRGRPLRRFNGVRLLELKHGQRVGVQPRRRCHVGGKMGPVQGVVELKPFALLEVLLYTSPGNTRRTTLLKLEQKNWLKNS